MVSADGSGLVFLVSPPRAGSTLLAAMLGNHPRVLAPPEPWFLLPLVGLWEGELAVAARFDYGLARQAVQEWLTPRLAAEGVSAFTRAVCSQLLVEAGKDVFLDKTPRYYQILPHLARIFPAAPIVLLTRNPLDVAASLHRTWGISVAELTGEPVTPYTFDATMSFLLMADFLDAADRRPVCVHYEQLVLNPQAELRRVCAALGLEYEEGMEIYGQNAALMERYGRAAMGDKRVTGFSQAHQGSVDQWLRVLSPADVRQLVLTLGTQLFVRLGYENALGRALAVAGLSSGEAPADGQLRRLRAEYDAYLQGQAGATPSPGVQYSRLWDRAEQLERSLRAASAELAEKEQALQRLAGAADERLRLIRELTERLEEVQGARIREREKVRATADARLEVIRELQRELGRRRRWDFGARLRAATAPHLGVLHQYPPRRLVLPASYARAQPPSPAPRISLVTPSYNQAEFLERTLRSVLDQCYPELEYVVQDGASADNSMEVVERYADRLAGFDSRPDHGFAEALNRGFARATSGEIMAYLNSDDLLLPGALATVARYFAEHPEVDVVYGHRVVIDEYDAEIGRWVLPGHDDEVLSWADYIPQETLFWRRRIWEKAGGFIDESFTFAVDWDLLLRFREAGAKMVRLPRFLGAFRVHPHQKTTAQISDLGASEMARLRERVHGRKVGPAEIAEAIRPYLRRHVVYHKLWRLGILRY